MEFDMKNLFIAFIITLLSSIFLIFFVFVSTIFSLFDVLMFILINSSIFLGAIMLLAQMQYGGFPIDVTIFERRANSVYINKDRAKRIASAEAGKFAYLLKRKKVKTKPIDIGYLYQGMRGQNYLNLHMPQIGEFHPVTIDEANSMKITHENARYWYSEQLRRNAERWAKKFGFEKYANMIQMGMTGIIIALLLYIFLGQMQGVIAQMGGITSAQAELMKEIATLIKIASPSGAPIAPIVP